MADLSLPADLIERLNDLARREQRSVQNLLERWLTEHATQNPEPQKDDSEQREARLKADRLRLYVIARSYWRSNDDPRQDLTDAQLEDEFWLFDQNGIPRLKSDQGTVYVEESPLQSMLKSIERDPSLWSFGDTAQHVSEHSREILRNEYADYLMARLRRPAPPDDK